MKRCGTSIYNTELMRSISLVAGRDYPGKLSPADLPSRYIMASELTDQVLWWQGPDFLMGSNANWPTIEAYDLNHKVQMEMAKDITLITLSLVTTNSTFVCQAIKELHQLLHVTSYVIWLIKECRKQTHSCESSISHTEMNQSELLWIKSYSVMFLLIKSAIFLLAQVHNFS